MSSPPLSGKVQVRWVGPVPHPTFTKGQLIAYVGDSGNAEWTGPHTHFELHYNGRPINPYPHLVAAMKRDEAERLLRKTLELLEQSDYEMR